MHKTGFATVIAGMVGALAIVACGQSPAPAQKPAGGGQMVPTYSEATGRLSQIKYDKNNDGKIDTWATMDGARVQRIEIDTNADGKVDRWEYYKPGTTPGVPGILERVEIAAHPDGRITRREFLENGVLRRIEEDTDEDGAVDTWQTYVDGSLAVLELDTSHRGRADRRLVYGHDGNVERVEVDPDGSGRFRPAPHDR